MDDGTIDYAAIAETLAATGVYAGDGTADLVDPAQVAQLESILAGSGVPLYVVVVRPAEDGGITGGSDLLTRVHDSMNEAAGGQVTGVFVGINNVWGVPVDGEPSGNALAASGEELNLAVQQWGVVEGSTDQTTVVDDYLSHGDAGNGLPLGDGLVALAGHLADDSFDVVVTEAGEGYEAFGVQLDARREETGSSSGSSGIPGDGGDVPVVGISLALLAVLVVVTLLVALGRTRRRAAQLGSRRSATFALPDSMVDRVRRAGDEQLVRRARADVLALGERIDEAEMAADAGPAWQAALDHYEAASRLLPADAGVRVDPLDAVGAVVLAERGTAALAAARKDRPFVPTTPCFLNPLHGAGNRDRTLQHGEFEVDAPVCPACRRDLGAGRRPDILDVLHDGRPEHYFETDREPWASTGFGALEPDLVTRLHGMRR